ncbi:hypothetical protein J2W91_002702 [Paenibacillus amylolyticus]|uniref:Uncharacterized protein n=1 Tax=Paenibacillus amylolyticus TaxID=1451 RepID=A0AAP5H2U0_PAEAM|nr:hypothetical protein [Paenibacillus amylolyticus]MDR6724240.1 hypothetical protein [Paenibacillus amylolyticus]
MKNLEKIIWIEAEQWAKGQWDIDDVNTDVTVVFSNRMKWITSFFTYKNIQTLREKNTKNGECMNGGYFYSSDMVLINIGSKERIYEVVNFLIETEKFETVFTRYPDVELMDDEYYPKGLLYKK